MQYNSEIQFKIKNNISLLYRNYHLYTLTYTPYIDYCA